MADFVIKIKKDVISDILEFAKETYPKEFFAFLEGKLTKDGVFVKNIAYHPFNSDESSAETIFHMGTNTQGFVGTVHSHPSGSNNPSNVDLRGFSKEGIIHLIVSSPFKENDIKCFGPDGKTLGFIVA